ncbi:MAG: hypothetical protein CMB13_06490 [Euryarchaeota archaeon]|nr:hypothetical protein [Euryarchaeota archaeon]
MGSRMAEFPQGEVVERRRGGPGVLALLMLDATRSRFNGHLRIESLDGAVGGLGIIEGMPAMALYTSGGGEVAGGRDAMDRCLNSSADPSAALSVHSGNQVSSMMDSHPHSRLLRSDLERLEEEPWWSDSRHRDLVAIGRQKSRWTSIESSFSRTGDEPIQFESVTIPKMVEDGPYFGPGESWLVDDELPDSVLSIGSNLGSLGRPLMVFSRLPPEKLRSKYSIPNVSSILLTERPTQDGELGPSLEGIMRRIEDYLFANPRAVVVLDGIEFLIGLHGFDRVYDFLRNLSDLVAESDDLLLCPFDGLALSPQERALLQREMKLLDTRTASEWGSSSGHLVGHPFIIHAMTTEPVQRAKPLESIASPSPESPSFGVLDSTGELPAPVPDGGPQIGGLIAQWKEESIVEEPSTIENIEPETMLDDYSEGVVEDEHDSENEFALPDWATAPSPNRGDVVESTTPELPPPPQQPVPHTPVVAESVPIIEEEIYVPTPGLHRPEATPQQPSKKRKGRRSPTVDHKPKGRVHSSHSPTEFSLKGSGLVDAVNRWREIGILQDREDTSPAIPATGPEISPLTPNDGSNLPVDGSDVVRNARRLDPDWNSVDQTAARLHEIVHSMAKESTSIPNPISAPSTAREFSQVAQRVRPVRNASLGTTPEMVSSLPDDFYDRVANLVEKGADITTLMAAVERSPITAIEILERMEGES